MDLHILVLADRELVSAGVRVVLSKAGAGMCFEAAADLPEALAAIERCLPTLCIIALSHEPRDLLRALRTLTSKTPALRIIVLSSDIRSSLVKHAFRAGACAFLPMSIRSEDFLHAAQAAIRGERCIAIRELSAMLATDPALVPPSQRAEDQLTRRDIQVIKLLTSDRPQTQISHDLKMGSQQFRRYCEQVMRKVGVGTTAQLTKCAVRMGLVSLNKSS